jgi:hypothetical protein
MTGLVASCAAVRNSTTLNGCDLSGIGRRKNIGDLIRASECRHKA